MLSIYSIEKARPHTDFPQSIEGSEIHETSWSLNHYHHQLIMTLQLQAANDFLKELIQIKELK